MERLYGESINSLCVHSLPLLRYKQNNKMFNMTFVNNLKTYTNKRLRLRKLS